MSLNISSKVLVYMQAMMSTISFFAKERCRNSKPDTKLGNMGAKYWFNPRNIYAVKADDANVYKCL